MYPYAHTHTHTNTHARAHRHTHTHTHAHTHTCTYTHMYIHTHSHIYTLTYTHAHNHIHAHKWTQITTQTHSNHQYTLSTRVNTYKVPLDSLGSKRRSPPVICLYTHTHKRFRYMNQTTMCWGFSGFPHICVVYFDMHVRLWVCECACNKD